MCWNTGFFQTPCCQTKCEPNIDLTWQIRIYASDPACEAVPGTQIGFSSITVQNKIEGTGQGVGTWHYSGKLITPISLPTFGPGSNPYWFEVSAFGESGCEVRATWSRDHGNEHIAQAVIASAGATRKYRLKFVEAGPDLGFCENSGIAAPDAVLGSCSTCPTNCHAGFSSRD